MDYSIDIGTLEDAAKQIRNTVEDIKTHQEQLYMIYSLLLAVGWTGESANQFEQRYDALDESFDSYQKRNEIVFDLLQQLSKGVHDANDQACALAAIWSVGFGGVMDKVAKKFSKFNPFGPSNDGIVSLNRAAAEQVHSICRKLNNRYTTQEERAEKIRSLHSMCYEDFNAIGYICTAINEMNVVKNKINYFDKALSEYEASVDLMEKTAQSAASHISPVEPFKVQ